MLEKLIIMILNLLIEQLSTPVKQALRELINRLDEIVKETPNPYDDLLLKFLHSILKIEE